MLKYKNLIAVVVVVALGLWGFSCHERRVGELNGKIAHLVSESHRVDTVYKTTVKTLTRVRKVTDSVLTVDTVQSLMPIDTVRLLVNRERAACDRVILTCEQRVAIKDSIIAVLKKKPSVWSHIPWVAAGILGGVLLTR